MKKETKKELKKDIIKNEKLTTSITLGAVCFMLCFAIMVQIKTIKTATKEIGTRIADNSGLRDEVLVWQENNRKIYKQLEKSEKELEQIRTDAISKDERCN